MRTERESRRDGDKSTEQSSQLPLNQVSEIARSRRSPYPVSKPEKKRKRDKAKVGRGGNQEGEDGQHSSRGVTGETRRVKKRTHVRLFKLST